MIKNIFIPETIGSYYIFSQRIIGIDITKTAIYATRVKAHGHKRTIEQLIEQPLSTQAQLSHEERVSQALGELAQKLGRYNKLYAALSSSLIVFKELSVPFTGPTKIKTIVPFEVEALLPFSLEQAAIDSIITRETTQETDIFVAAAKQEHVTEFLNLFAQAQLPVDKITVDMFELYALYKSIPTYQQLTGIVTLVDMGLSTTRLALIVHGQLKYIRVLSKGLINIAKKLASATHSDIATMSEHLVRFGLEQNEQPEYTKASHEALQDLLQDIKFTVSSYTAKLKTTEKLERVIMSGAGADIPGIEQLMQETLETECELLHAKKIMHNKNIQSAVNSIPNSFLVSLATALALPVTQEFNLQQAREQEQEDRLINKQLITAGILIGLLFTGFSLYSYLSIRTLRRAVQTSSAEAINELKRVFKLKDAQATTLDAAIKQARRQLENEESTWQKLSPRTRYMPLRILTELSKCINFKELSLDVQTLKIKDTTVELYGSVPDHKSLDILQKQLECPLFRKIGILYDISFKSTPIKLTVKSDEEA